MNDSASQEGLAMTGDSVGYHNVAGVGVCVLLAFSGYRLGVLLNVLQYTGQLLQYKII